LSNERVYKSFSVIDGTSAAQARTAQLLSLRLVCSRILLFFTMQRARLISTAAEEAAEYAREPLTRAREIAKRATAGLCGAGRRCTIG